MFGGFFGSVFPSSLLSSCIPSTPAQIPLCRTSDSQAQAGTGSSSSQPLIRQVWDWAVEWQGIFWHISQDKQQCTHTYTYTNTHTHTDPVDSFLSKSPSHANRVGRQDPLSAYLSEGGFEKGQTAWTPSIVLVGFKRWGGRDGTRDRMGIGDPNNATKPPTALPAYEHDLLWQTTDRPQHEGNWTKTITAQPKLLPNLLWSEHKLVPDQTETEVNFESN